MCGISGFIKKSSACDSEIKRFEDAAFSLQRHRGPDNFDSYINEDKTVGLFHNRLSLIDLSDLGNQPMSKHGLTLVFNGEIYNFRELRQQLLRLGYKFISEADTEVILSAYDAWGDEALNKFNGAYALALYNSKAGSLLLARDKVGEKPLFYSHIANEYMYFASDITLLRKVMLVSEFKINYNRFLSDLIFNFWSDKSITHFDNIFTLQPGNLIKINSTLEPHTIKYWDLENVDINDKENRILGDIEALLLDAVKIRVNLDEKIGSILSGGIDSSLITKIAQNNLNYHLSTFTLEKFGHIDADLASARKISHEYAWNNYSVKIRPSDLSKKKLKSVTKSMDEPILDQVYIYINRNYEEVHKKSLKAVLNGQGSDEIFLGYLDYYPFLRNTDCYSSYSNFRDFWYEKFILKDYIDKDTVMSSIEQNLNKHFTPYISNDPLNSVLRFGVKTHMPALLNQEDKQSMAWSVECRTVYTDYRLVEYLNHIPSKMKYTDNKEKYLLRKIANKYLPDYITNRKKLGFPDLPDGRDKLIREIIDSKYIERSQIIDNLFSKKITNIISNLPLAMQWKLCAFTIFEKVWAE